jgi:hypothetical protein
MISSTHTYLQGAKSDFDKTITCREAVSLYARLNFQYFFTALFSSCPKKMKLYSATILVLLATGSFYSVEVSTQIILEVPGYGVLNGTTGTSSYTDRLFYTFRSVYYAEKPTPETRFLVINILINRSSLIFE